MSADRKKVKDCQQCQVWVNAKTEEWEIIKKQNQELIKPLNCEGHGTNNIDYFDDEGQHIFTRTPKNFHTDYCTNTNTNCIPADGMPNKIIRKTNGWGDEWVDTNHNCQEKPKPTNLGPDYASLQPTQQEGRQKTQASWTKKKNISFCCLHCQTSFPYDKSIANYCEARKKAQKELTTHMASCSWNNNTNEGKLKAQNWWTGIRNSKTRIIKTCEKCWGKVLWDKSIIAADEARVQALSDLKYHQEHECHLTPTQRTIAIYHSPNQGGHQHAPMDTSLLNTDDGVYTQDQDGEAYQNQGTQQPTKFNWKSPGVIGTGLVLVLGIIGLVLYFVNKEKKEK